MLYQRTSGLHNNYANPGIACIHSQAVMGRDENSNNFFLQLENQLIALDPKFNKMIRIVVITSWRLNRDHERGILGSANIGSQMTASRMMLVPRG